MTDFPSPRLRRFFPLYTALWVVLLPFAVGYLAWRGWRDRMYIQHLGERFGRYARPVTPPAPTPRPVWVHAVSLGEVRSAVPLIRALMADGESVVTTHFTPTGRREVQRIFADDIAAGRLHCIWVPLEFHWCYTHFFDAFKPRYGLVMEIEVWPVMIHAAHKTGIPLYPCNAQYPRKSFERDRDTSRWRFDLMAGYPGACVKSELQRDRFAAAGTANIHITGELRFDQSIPPAHVAAARNLKDQIGRRTVTITSVVAGEDATYIATIKALQGPDAPLFVYVPRAPERFDETCTLLSDAGLTILRRSEAFTPDFVPQVPLDVDVIVGDSMGEMYFYLALCDLAVIGGSFVPKGAHNISEPLALSKPVVCGPHTWTIEFPFVEAQTASVAAQVADHTALTAYIRDGKPAEAAQVADFFAAQSGAVKRTLAALQRLADS